MGTNPAKNPVIAPQPTAPTLVVALFMNVKYAHGALADLANASIPGDRIAVTFSAQGEPTMRPQFDAVHPGEANDEYPLVWRLKHGFENDLHHHGPELLSGKDATSAESSVEHPYYVVDLYDTLRGIGVAEDRILLLDRALGMHGVLIMVEAGDDWRQVQSLLENDCGQIRTDSATEREHVQLDWPAAF